MTSSVSVGRQALKNEANKVGVGWAKTALFSALISTFLLSLIEGGAWLWLHTAPARLPLGNVATGTISTDWFGILNDDLAPTAAPDALYLPDTKLFWKLRPNTKASLENIVYKTRGAAIHWGVTINSDGYRGVQYPTGGGTRGPVIATLGDSCTFGFRVNDADTYPAQLQQMLRSHGLRDAVVNNYGVPGYSSFQGLRLLHKILEQRRPDVVILAFGANDLEADRYSDEEKAALLTTIRARLGRMLYRLSITKVMTGNIFARRTATTEPTAATVRVPPEAFGKNMREMVAMAQKAGARVILLNIAFMKEDNGTVLAEIARERGVPWIDGPSVLLRGLDDMISGKRLQRERKDLDRFWEEQVLQYRYVYYPEEFYHTLLQIPYWPNLLSYLMIEPVHPNRIGYRLIAEATVRRIAGMGNVAACRP